MKEEELKSLSAFTDFIETLNLDDLGREGEASARGEISRDQLAWKSTR